jgi:hypothetical protein
MEAGPICVARLRQGRAHLFIPIRAAGVRAAVHDKGRLRIMLRNDLVWAGISFAVLCGASFAACSSTTEEPPPPDEHQPGKQPPARPDGAPTGDNPPGHAYGISKLFLGGTDRNGSPNPSAWKQYGYNLDGLVSVEGSPNHCRPAAGGSPKVMNDGNEGIDNGFGKTLWPLVLSFANDAEETVNSSISDGAFTVIVQIDGLGTKPSYVDLEARLYAGADLGAVPHFDGTDMWPVAPELLCNPDMPDVTCSKVTFDKSYVNEGTWVSGSPGTLDLTVGVAGFSLTLNIQKAILSMELSADRKKATNGVIAGVIPTEALVEQLRNIAGAFSQELCEGTTVESLLDQIRAASDILQDGTQDPSKTCDGISIGLGFDAGEIQIGPVAPKTPPGTDPCAAGGMGGMGGSGGSTGGGGAGGSSTGGGGAGGA